MLWSLEKQKVIATAKVSYQGTEAFQVLTSYLGQIIFTRCTPIVCAEIFKVEVEMGELECQCQ